ncbi:MAG TPA: tetratricopeptide repeat protein [Acidobacteriaceae bacterium]|nr:tetratricopeptide repeat protein [Acidobacteriaceae bacterium]
MFRLRQLLRVLIPAFFVFAPLLARAQQAASPAGASTASAAEEPHGRLLLVLPFENKTGQPNLDWIGFGAADIFNRRLDAAGFLTISRDDRLYALDRLGLPPNFRPSRATTIRIAQLLDADFVIIGDYTLAGTQLAASARILNLHQLTLSPPITEQADLKGILDTFNRLAWDVARKLDPTYSVAEQTFLAADGPLRPDAFENYIRGMIAEAPADRIEHLREAVRLSPGFTPARLELGRAYFADQDYDDAAATFGQMPRDDPNALEADFYRGLALFFTGKYLRAEDAFAFVATELPLPEVVNNEGVAASRRGRDGTALFREAIAADPRDADYHFNLAIALRKHNDIPGAISELQTDLRLHPQDTEAQSFLGSLEKPAPASTPAPAPTPSTPAQAAEAEESLPLERIKRTYDETEFRQAAFEMEQLQEARLAVLPPAQRAERLVASGDQFLLRGLILEAEREYQDALKANPASALAHAGLAEVRERSFDLRAARSEAQQSLQLAPNVPAYLVLARLDLQSNQLSAAANEVNAALRLDPHNAGALGMKQAVEAKGQQAP